MKKIKFVMLAVLLLAASLATADNTQKITLGGDIYAVHCYDNGALLISKMIEVFAASRPTFFMTYEDSPSVYSAFDNIRYKYKEWNDVAKANNVQEHEKVLYEGLTIKSSFTWTFGGDIHIGAPIGSVRIKATYRVSSGKGSMTISVPDLVSTSNRFIRYSGGDVIVFDTPDEMDELLELMRRDRVNNIMQEKRHTDELFK